MSAVTYQFASAEWVDFARAYVLEKAEGQNLDGLSVSFCEIFTDAPAELDPDGAGRIGWYIRVADGNIDVDHGILPEPDLCITADYATVLPLARLVFAGNEAAAARAQQAVEAAMAAGTMARTGDESVMARLPWLANLHDDLARRTA